MTEIYPVQLADELQASMAGFAESMVRDTATREILEARIRHDPAILTDFPEFEMEPTLAAGDDGTVVAGITIAHARTYMGPGTTSKLRISENLPLAVFSHLDSGSMALTANFVDQLRRVGIDPTGPEPLETMQRWLANWQSIQQAMHGETQIDPLYDTVGLTKAIAERPPYHKTHGLVQTDLPPYDFEALVRQYDWMTNVPVPEDRAAYMEFLHTYLGLMTTRGAGNVYFSLGAFNTSNGSITRVPGQLGLYAKKGSMADISANFAFTVTRQA